MSNSERRGLRALDVVDALRMPLLLLDETQRILHLNREYCRVFRTDGDDSFGLPLSKIGNGAWNFKILRAHLNRVISANEAFKNFEVSVEFPKLGRRTMLLEAVRFGRTSPPGPMILLTFDDITRRRKDEADLRRYAEELTRSNGELEKFAYIASRQLLEPMRSLVRYAEMITGRDKGKTAAAFQSGAATTESETDGLTPREREILLLITDGSINKEIARKLMIGVRTVESHRQSLMMKLDIRTTAGLTKYALASGLIRLK